MTCYNFFRPSSATTHPTVRHTVPSNPPENPNNFASNLNHLEMLSQYTWPGIAISIAQQEALYRKYLHGQLQQSVGDRRVEQAYSPSDSGVVNPMKQESADEQNVTRSPLQPPMQPPRPQTFVMHHTGILLQCNCAGVAHRIPRFQHQHMKMQA